MDNEQDQDEAFWAPGTVRLEDSKSRKSFFAPEWISWQLKESQSDSEHYHILQSTTPSADPNDPLNWPTTRKVINFTLVIFFVL